jgi:carboxypeptidase C (cathepsin A)
MYGLFKENGPFLVEAKNPPNGEPYLIANPYSWHKEANMLFVDNPIGTGFSHKAGGQFRGQFDETQIERELSEFLKQFLQLYPHYVNSSGAGDDVSSSPKIYLFGESYGGTYVVKLAELLTNGNFTVSNKKTISKTWIIG